MMMMMILMWMKMLQLIMDQVHSLLPLVKLMLINKIRLTKKKLNKKNKNSHK